MILIALGANLPSPAGPPEATLRAALKSLAARVIKVEKVSGFYRSAAWPNASDPPYVNAVASIATDLAPEELLGVLHDVEAEFGRVRGLKNAPRTLDLDLIDYEGRVEHGRVELPHPRVESRAFVLVPLRDVAPNWRHPVRGNSVSDLIAAVLDPDVAPLA